MGACFKVDVVVLSSHPGLIFLGVALFAFGVDEFVGGWRWFFHGLAKGEKGLMMWNFGGNDRIRTCDLALMKRPLCR